MWLPGSASQVRRARQTQEVISSTNVAAFSLDDRLLVAFLISSGILRNMFPQIVLP